MNAVVAGHAVAAPAPHHQAIMLSVMASSIMQSLDNTIANVALPHIQGSLSATQDQMTWVLTSYIVAVAIMTPLSGWLAGRIGRKTVFLFSIAGFTIASVLCGVAQSLVEIVTFRVLQGLCGAALVPLSQAVLLDIYPRSQHSRVMGIWIMGVILGPIIGPALGGWLTENYSWRWVFYINIPFGILAFLGVSTYMPDSRSRTGRFDMLGFVALAISLGAFQLFFDRGQLKDWFSSMEIRIEAVVAVVAFYIFIVHMLTTRKEPFVSPALFKDRNFVTGSIFIFQIGIVLFATLALLPPLLQNLLHYPVVLTGLVTVPRGLGTLLAMVLMRFIPSKLDTRFIIATGFALTAISLQQMTHFYEGMAMSIIVWSGLLQGLGTGLVFVPLAAVTFGTLAPRLRNEGTAVFSLLRNIGSSIGISMVTALLVRNTQIMHARLAEHVTPFGQTLHSVWQSQVLQGASLARLNAGISTQAAMIAYNNDFKLMLILTVLSIPFVALLRTARAPDAGDAVVAVE